MGWSITSGVSRRQILTGRTRDQETKSCTYNCLTSCVRGNILWTVWDLTTHKTGKTERFIGCDIIGTDGEGNWGYKDMCESMGPCYYTCPLKYLEMAPVAREAWRKKVREYHALRKAVKPGAIVVFCEGCCVDRVTVLGIRHKKKLVGAAEDGRRYRFSISQVAEVISADCVSGGS